MRKIVVIATENSGSIDDWRKVKRIVPLFTDMGFENTRLHVARNHREARKIAAGAVAQGCRWVISAGGSGTFNNVLEGCMDSGAPIRDVRLGFLRKGSADLIGKVLGMPDDVEKEVELLAESIKTGRFIDCDIISVSSLGVGAPDRHLTAFGGVGIFGLVPRYTENRFVKYYKGVLGQLFGDLGPFAVGVTLAIAGAAGSRVFKGRTRRRISVDGKLSGEGYYSAIVVVNGDLCPNLPLARSAPLGSGQFHVFALTDRGGGAMVGQLLHTWDASILDDPEKYGLQVYTPKSELRLTCLAGPNELPVNVVGMPMTCLGRKNTSDLRY